jgi:hypothetical protein
VPVRDCTPLLRLSKQGSVSNCLYDQQGSLSHINTLDNSNSGYRALQFCLVVECFQCQTAARNRSCRFDICCADRSDETATFHLSSSRLFLSPIWKTDAGSIASSWNRLCSQRMRLAARSQEIAPIAEFPCRHFVPSRFCAPFPSTVLHINKAYKRIPWFESASRSS